jgi:nicotinamide riboside kinase
LLDEKTNCGDEKTSMQDDFASLLKGQIQFAEGHTRVAKAIDIFAKHISRYVYPKYYICLPSPV